MTYINTMYVLNSLNVIVKINSTMKYGEIVIMLIL